MNVKVIHTKYLRWIDIISPGEEELNYLKKNFNFHPIDYQDIINPSQRAKIEERDDHQFIALLFPIFNKTSREIRASEINFIAGRNYLITIHDGSMYTIQKFFNSVSNTAAIRANYMGKNSGYLLYQILEALFQRSFPILDHISADLADSEKNIFTDLGISMLEKITLMKKNITDFRRIMKTHHIVIRKLMTKKNVYMAFSSAKEYYNILLEHAEHIWDILALQKETVDALQDTHQALAANNLNQITKLMTIFSGIFLPATLIIFVFGVNPPGMPFQNNPNGFWIVMILATVSSLMMILYFKSKKWF